MTTDDSKAALALAEAMLEVEDADGPEDVESVAAAILAAMPEWTLVRSDARLRPNAIMVEQDAEIDRLTAASEECVGDGLHDCVCSCHAALVPQLDDIHGTPTFSGPG